MEVHLTKKQISDAIIIAKKANMAAKLIKLSEMIRDDISLDQKIGNTNLTYSNLRKGLVTRYTNILKKNKNNATAKIMLALLGIDHTKC